MGLEGRRGRARGSPLSLTAVIGDMIPTDIVYTHIQTSTHAHKLKINKISNNFLFF